MDSVRFAGNYVSKFRSCCGVAQGSFLSLGLDVSTSVGVEDIGTISGATFNMDFHATLDFPVTFQLWEILSVAQYGASPLSYVRA